MLTIRLDSPVPMTEQIVRGVRAAIARGELGPADELPSVRRLASDLGINLNTVARAYRTLEESGLVTSVRGRGTRVISDSEKSTVNARERRRRLLDWLDVLLTDAKLAGLNRRATQQLITKQMAAFWPAR